MAHQFTLYTAGSRIWIQEKEQWKGGVVVEDCNGKTLKYKGDEDGAVKVISSDPLQLPPLRNPDILIGLNDLTTLSYLHEPGVLYNLKYRFTEMKTIYTYCGIVLVAINPYQKLGIYGVETMWTYRGHAIGELEPHVFAVAEEAFKEMERASLNQSIIVSGESGAGKTVSAKYAMRYFATVGGAESVTSIERKVLASQPIMEAIGNAKTTRNDNSSRFGKYVELQFCPEYSIVGASMRTYLLEKSRVVFQATGERNYHIFYQMLTSADDEVSDLSLGSTPFNYTKTMSIKGVNDAAQFTDTVQSMKLLGFGIDDRRNYFKLLASILHLGNIVFKEKDEGCVIPLPSTPLTVLSNLLSISSTELTKWLTHRRIRSAHEEFLKPMKPSEAEFSRDALAKLMYDLSFNWIVERINETLKSEEECYKFIGVLDIYGFETFEINSFEQFCINYANEKLQQQFNSHMFKLDQEEYAKESIEWTFIDFYDNQPCIDLIETKLGILSLLDEETRMPAANDKSWTMKLYKECAKYGHFKIPKRADGEEFSIVHFASEVKYTSSGFLEKNRDTVLADQIETVKNSTNPFIASIIRVDVSAARRKTVSTQFRSSLSSLMTSLNSTTPHYIRCIKPNDEKLAFQFEESRALQQLRACGVLETVRIQASGFPTRWTYVDFAKRYRVLCKSTEIKRQDLKATSIGILERNIQDASTYKLGTTKIFFRSGVLAFLEKLRSAKLHSCILLIQKVVRGWVAKRRYAKIKISCALLQRYGRGFLARKKYLLMKQNAAAITIQKYARMYISRRNYTTLQRLICKFQTHCRMRLAIWKAQELRVLKATIIIQKNIRMYLIRKEFRRIRAGIILLQCCVRRLIAKRELRQLKLEARSLERVKELNKGLENKIIELQLRIESQTKLISKADSMAGELAILKAQVQQLKHLEPSHKQALLTIESHATTISQLESKLRHETDEKVDLVYRHKKLEGDCSDLKGRLERSELENSRLEEEIKKLMQQLVGYNNLKNDFESVERERAEERMAYQALSASKKNPVPIPAPRAKSTPVDSSYLTSLQIENSLLKKKLDESNLNALKVQDLEMHYEQTQKNYQGLLLSHSPSEDLASHIKELTEDLSLKREENLMLRSLLSSGNSDREVITTLEQQLTSEKMMVKQLMDENKRLRVYSGKDEDSIYETAAYELNGNRILNQSPSNYNPAVSQLLPRREAQLAGTYTGLLQYDPASEHRILKSILVDLKPTVALSLDSPTLPAFIILMMIKYNDSLNDETRVSSLFKSFVKLLKKVVEKRNQFEYNVLWLSNVLRLLHNLKQYSGDPAFVRENTHRQNEQCLVNFDLVEFRQGLSDLGLRIYITLIKNFEDQVQPLIVPAILESSPELTSSFVKRDKSKPMETLTRELTGNYELLLSFHMDVEVVTQIFKQLFYYLTAASMNNLLLRKDLCNWANGIQIRYNISTLEEWCRVKGLDSIIPTLHPIIQASRLLQANKSDKDVEFVCEMCDELTVGQVIKILHLFTADEEELRISSSFIKQVQLRLNQRKSGSEASQQLLMDTKLLLPVKFPYHPSNIKLDELNIPESLGLAELVTKL